MSLLDNIDDTSFAQNNNKIKFLVLVRKNPTKEEAMELFKEVLDSIENHSARPGVWNYYDGLFQIMSQDGAIIFEATKRIDGNLQVVQKSDNL
jgi:hypothetical protein